MNVTLYAICRNEEKNVQKFLSNTKKFTDVVVVDTGSTDNTVNLLREAGIKVYEHPQKREEFDFSLARNQALSYVTTDWAFSLDFNEDISDFEPEGFSPIENEFTNLKHLRFDDKGENNITQSDEVHVRLHRTKSYEWVNAVHEVPKFIPTKEYPVESSVETSIKITKKINKTLAKEIFYFNICEREYKKDQKNSYYIWFIFNHYFEVKNSVKALEFGQEYLDLSKPYFDTFRVLVFIKCSICLFNLKNYNQAANYAFHALSEAMNLGEPYLSRAFIYLNELSQLLNNPNITIFATGFNPNTLSSQERTNAINNLYLTNLEDIPTCWKGHRRFAEWLVNEIKPEVIVDLGVDYGFSSFCFGMQRVGHVYGIDSFEGDDFTGKTHGSYEFVMEKRKRLLMEENITFIKGYFNDVADSWNKTIDILHIDGSHHYEDIKNDYETWSKFLSEDGVILLHDTCVEEINGNRYGVKRFFEEINLPKVNFINDFGLGVISKNSKIIDKVKKTFNL